MNLTKSLTGVAECSESGNLKKGGRNRAGIESEIETEKGEGRLINRARVKGVFERGSERICAISWSTVILVINRFIRLYSSATQDIHRTYLDLCCAFN